MKAVFADTSYYIALLGGDDAYHDSAVAWSQSLLGSTVVTEYVLVELGSALCRSKQRSEFAPFVQQLLRDAGTVFVPSSPSLLQQGLKLFAARPDKTWSLVDCLSFVVMKQRRLKQALTTDHHFEQAGFQALLRGDGPP